MISRTAAIREAKTRISDVYRCGSGPTGWGYNTWSDLHRAWFLPGNGTDYQRARRQRAETIAEIAARLMLESAGRDVTYPPVWCDWRGQWPGIEAAVDQMVREELP